MSKYQSLLITSVNPGVGKTTFTFGLALKFKKKGINVGYFKPISDRSEDTDALDAKNLLGMEEDVSTICPSLITVYEYDMDEKQVEEIKEKIKKAYEVMKNKYDLVIIEMARKMGYLSYLNLSAKHIAKMLDAKVLVITEGRDVEDADRVLLAHDFFKSMDVPVIGSIFSLVPEEIKAHFRTMICPELIARFGADTFGLILAKEGIAAPTVAEIASSINARVLAGKDYMNNLVENYVVGAMEPEAALKYFRRSIRKAVVTGGDRPQLAIAAMETDTSVIILTGSIRPPASVLAKAEEKRIPILLVAGDTFSTIRALTDQPIYGKIHFDQADKIAVWDEVIEGVDYKRILKELE